MRWLKQSTAATIPVGPFLDKTDGVTPETGLADQSANGRLIKNGTGGAITVSSWAHDADGLYLVGLSTTHTNTLGMLRLSFSDEATYCHVWEDFLVLPANVYDSLVSGSDNLNTEVASYGAGLSPATNKNILKG